MDSEKKTRIREKIFGKRLASILGEGADKFGHYKESYGGGTPLKAGQKAPSKQWVEDNRVMQPRDEEGKFTYNAVNGKDLKYPSTRGTTMSPLLDGAKLTFIRTGDKFKFEDGKVVMAVGDVDLNKILREYTSLGFGEDIDIPDELFVKKEGRRSKAEKDAGYGFVGHRDIRTMGETQKKKIIDSYNATGRKVIESMVTEDGVNKAFKEFEMTIGGKKATLPVKTIIEDTKEIEAPNKDTIRETITSTLETLDKGTSKFVRKKKTDAKVQDEKPESTKEAVEEPKLSTEKQSDKETMKVETKDGEPKEEVSEKEETEKVETKEVEKEPQVETKETKVEPQAEKKEEPKAEPQAETQEEEKTRVDRLFGGKKAKPTESEQATGEELDKVDELFGGRTERTPKQNVIGIDQLQEDLGIDKIETEEELSEWFKNNYPLIKGTFDTSKRVRKIKPMLEQVAKEISKQYNITDFKGTRLEPYGRMVTPLTLFKYILGNGINSEESLREKLDKDLRGIKNGK